jgi:hypothetical protein
LQDQAAPQFFPVEVIVKKADRRLTVEGVKTQPNGQGQKKDLVENQLPRLGHQQAGTIRLQGGGHSRAADLQLWRI